MADDAAPSGVLEGMIAGAEGAEVLLTRLAPIAERSADTASKRQAAAILLKDVLEEGRAQLRARFDSERRVGSVTARAIAATTDAVVIAAFRFVSEHLLPRGAPTKAEQITLAAVGGYGTGRDGPLFGRRSAVRHPLQADSLGRERDRSHALHPLGP